MSYVITAVYYVSEYQRRFKILLIYVSFLPFIIPAYFKLKIVVKATCRLLEITARSTFEIEKRGDVNYSTIGSGVEYL